MQVKEKEKAKKEEDDDDLKNGKVIDKQGEQINGMLKLNRQDNQTNMQTFKTLQEQTKDLELANKNIQNMKKNITISNGILRNISCKELYYKLALMVLILLLGAADIWLIMYQLGKNFKKSSA
jgi:transcriptional/translational regulatory protein YebC/TACO1